MPFRRLVIRLSSAFLFLSVAAPALAAMQQAPVLAINIPTLQLTNIAVANGYIDVPWIGQYMRGVYSYGVAIAAVLAGVMFVVGGFQYLTAGGDASRVQKARTRIADACVGMFLVYGAYTILITVNTSLVSFKSLRIRKVARIEFGSGVSDHAADAIESGIEPPYDPSEAAADAAAAAAPVPEPSDEGAPTPPTAAAPSGTPPTSSATTSADGGTAFSQQPPPVIPNPVTWSYCASGTVGTPPFRRHRMNATLRPTAPNATRRTAWCADCGVTCGERHDVDQVCRQIAGANGEGVPCGGAFGLFLRSMTANCSGKHLDDAYGLDGLTFGIQDLVLWNVPEVLQNFDRTDHTAFMRVFQDADLDQWYHNGTINRDWFCQQAIERHGLACSTNFMRGFRASLRERAMISAQLQHAYNSFRSRFNAGAAQFTTMRGRIMWATWLNNPGACGGNLAPLVARCGGGSQDEKYECFLREAPNIPCRNSPGGARGRAESIRRALSTIPADEPAGTIDSLDEIISRCVH